jgi:hypothetical protein
MELPQRNDHGQRSVVTRRRAGLLLIVLVATSLLAIVGSLLWPEPAVGDWYSYSDIAPIRERWWAVLTALSVGLVLNVPAQALAALILTPDRGAMWTTAGASIMWVGTGLYAVGGGGWAAVYFFGTHPALDVASGTRLLDQVAEDPRLFAARSPRRCTCGTWDNRPGGRTLALASIAALGPDSVPSDRPVIHHTRQRGCGSASRNSCSRGGDCHRLLRVETNRPSSLPAVTVP